MFLMQKSRLHFKQSRISMLISNICKMFGPFCKYLEVYLEINSFSQMISQMIVLKLEFEVKNW